MPCSKEQVAVYTDEIKIELQGAEVYSNLIEEKRLKNLSINMLQCNFAYDIDDVIAGRYIYITKWVDDNYDKNHWYSGGKNCVIIKNIYCQTNSSYFMLKKMAESSISKEEAIELQKKSTIVMIELI